MIVNFYDRQHLDNPLNGSSFGSGDSLISFMQTLTNRRPFFCDIIGDNEYKILVGLGEPWSCVQYSRADGDLPYLMALHNKDGDDGDDLEFLIGGTATPVPYRFRLSKSELEEIVQYFVETGEYAPNVSWEEI